MTGIAPSIRLQCWNNLAQIFLVVVELKLVIFQSNKEYFYTIFKLRIFWFLLIVTATSFNVYHEILVICSYHKLKHFDATRISLTLLDQIYLSFNEDEILFKPKRITLHNQHLLIYGNTVRLMCYYTGWVW